MRLNLSFLAWKWSAMFGINKIRRNTNNTKQDSDNATLRVCFSVGGIGKLCGNMDRVQYRQILEEKLRGKYILQMRNVSGEING